MYFAFRPRFHGLSAHTVSRCAAVVTECHIQRNQGMKDRGQERRFSSNSNFYQRQHDDFRDIGSNEWLSGHGGSAASPVVQLVRQRVAEGSTASFRTPGDTAKLGLVVEGGGMRGVISGGMLMALRSLGLHHAFDAVYGASAGAINLTYFLSGQSHGLNIYSEDLCEGTRFLDMAGILSGGPVMNLDFLIDDVMVRSKPLDWDAVLSAPWDFNVVASCLDSLQPVVMRGWGSAGELANALKASATVPQLAGPPRLVRGRRLVDAAVFEPVPVRSALRDGCTHVLVLCTRPATLHTTVWRRYLEHGLTTAVKRTMLNAPYMRAAWAAAESSSELTAQEDELVRALAAPAEETRRQLGGYVLPVYPTSTAGCSPITTNPRIVKAAEAEGKRAIAGLFNCPGSVFGEDAMGTAAAGGRGDMSTWGWGVPQLAQLSAMLPLFGRQAQQQQSMMQQPMMQMAQQHQPTFHR